MEIIIFTASGLCLTASEAMSLNMNIVQCIRNVSERYFKTESPLAISYLPEQGDNVNVFKDEPIHFENFEDMIFRELDQWATHVYKSYFKAPGNQNIGKHENYIIVLSSKIPI